MLLGHYKALYIITLPLIGEQSIVMHMSICVSLELLLQTSYFYAPHHIEALSDAVRPSTCRSHLCT